VFAIGLCVAAWLAVFADKTATWSVAEPIARQSTASSVQLPTNRAPTGELSQTDSGSSVNPTSKSPKLDGEPTILALRPREKFLGYASTNRDGGDLFTSKSWEPAPPPPAKPASPTPPSAPQFPYTYIGKKLEDAVWEVYLARGDQTFVIRPQSLIETDYRVESIQPPLVMLTYLPLNLMQTLIIEGAN